VKNETPAIPDIVVGRLPLYLRTLVQLRQAGNTLTSSQELGRMLGISPAQIRKDLSHFGGFGKQGTGYDVAFLIDQLSNLLRVDREWHVALVGAGDLGTAIIHYRGFATRGYQISLVFDNDPTKIGASIGGLVVHSTNGMQAMLRERHIHLAMLAVPAEAAQGVADRLIEGGCRAILCYAPTSLKLPAGIQVQYIDPVIHMQHMTFYLEPSDQTR
jgi:redox-sensing transcriptional repressor